MTGEDIQMIHELRAQLQELDVTADRLYDRITALYEAIDRIEERLCVLEE